MSTTVQTNRPQTVTIKQHLEGEAFKLAVAKALPKHLTADRFVRVALTAITRIPKLAECDQASFFQCLLKLSQFGLEPDGYRAHLIPFENRKRNVVECQLIIDYKGLVELALRSGVVANIHADVIRDGDIFEYSAGELSRHVPYFLRRDVGRPKEAGDVYAVYARAKFRDGSEKCDVMSLDEIERTRKRSRASNNGPWITDWTEMAKKTVVRRLSKWLPLSPEYRDAVDADTDTERDEQEPTGALAVFDIPAAPAPEIEEGNGNGEQEPTTPAATRTQTATASQTQTEPTIQQSLESLVIGAGSTFDAFKAAVIALGQSSELEAASWPDFNAVPDKVAKVCVSSKAGLVRALKGAK